MRGADVRFSPRALQLLILFKAPSVCLQSFDVGNVMQHQKELECGRLIFKSKVNLSVPSYREMWKCLKYTPPSPIRKFRYVEVICAVPGV